MGRLNGIKAASWIVALWSVAGLAAAGEPAAFRVSNSQGHHAMLLGSIHLLRPSDPLPQTIERLYRGADSLAMELDMDDLDPLTVGATMMAAGQLPPGQSITDHLDQEARVAMEAALSQLGLPLPAVERLEPWFMALTLMQLKMLQLGFDPSAGIEQRLLSMARRDGKEIDGLESVEDQIGLFDSLPMADQRALLLETLTDMAAMEDEMAELVGAWMSGDLSALEALLPQGFEDHPQLYDGLVVHRNDGFADRIEEILTRDSDVLVVVGVLHLVGESSLVGMLKKRGLTVRRVH